MATQETSKQKVARTTMRVFSPVHRWVYRTSRGRIGERWATGRIPVLLMTTTGRRSGQPHTTPVGYIPYEDGYIVIASKGGVPEHPNWYLNLREHPEVTIELRGERRRMRAEIQEGAAREPLWRLACERYPMFIGYQAQVTRQIPVIVLRPVAGATGSDPTSG